MSALLLVPMFRAWTDPTVPQWFEYDPEKPLAVFSAWKHLTTPRATICMGNSWTALGGILCDEYGHPLPRTPLSISIGRGHRWPNADLLTDDCGRFIIYGVGPRLLVQPSRDDLKKMPFAARLRFLDMPGSYACPGYPASADGWLFATSKKEIQQCEATLLLHSNNQAFYLLTVNAKNTFDQKEFAHFKKARYATRTHQPELKIERSQDPAFPGPKVGVRLLNWRNKPIGNALVGFASATCARTDSSGYCEVPYRVRQEGDSEIWKAMDKYLQIDAPGYVDGPVRYELRTNRLNVVKLLAPASVSGKILDSDGAPCPVMGLALHYTFVLRYIRVQDLAAFGLIRYAHRHADGSFRFDGVMPGETFQISVSDGWWRSVRTEELSLKPGEERKDIILRLAWPGAILGRLVDDSGHAVSKANVQLNYENAPPQSEFLREGGNGEFSFRGVGARPFEIEVEADGFERTLSNRMTLGPGELRLVEVRLRKGKPGEFVRRQ